MSRPFSTHPSAVRARLERTVDREKFLARKALSNAIARGDLVPGPCAVGIDCRGRIEGHHDDYSKPLDVRWLCKRHHRQADQWKRPKSPICTKCGGAWRTPPSGGKPYCPTCSTERALRSKRKTEVQHTPQNGTAAPEEAAANNND